MYQNLLMSARLPSEEGWVTAEHEGRLLLFYPSEKREGVQTAHGVSDAILCLRVVDLDSGQTYDETLIFGSGLVANISIGIPEHAVCGRLTKSTRGAWILAPHNPEELLAAQTWISENLT